MSRRARPVLRWPDGGCSLAVVVGVLVAFSRMTSFKHRRASARPITPAQTRSPPAGHAATGGKQLLSISAPEISPSSKAGLGFLEVEADRAFLARCCRWGASPDPAETCRRHAPGPTCGPTSSSRHDDPPHTPQKGTVPLPVAYESRWLERGGSKNDRRIAGQPEDPSSAAGAPSVNAAFLPKLALQGNTHISRARRRIAATQKIG